MMMYLNKYSQIGSWQDINVEVNECVSFINNKDFCATCYHVLKSTVEFSAGNFCRDLQIVCVVQ